MSKISKLKGTNENVTTSLIYGSLWDATLEWLVDTENKTYTEISTQNGSLTWGNYRDCTFSYTDENGETVTKGIGGNIIIPAGSTEYTKANNIYDLAGNASEMTLETAGNDYIYRGARRTNSGNVYGDASYREKTYTNGRGYRAIMNIN